MPSGSTIDKYCTDLVNNVLVAGGLPSTRERGAKLQADYLRSHSWRNKTWAGSCEDGSVLYYRQGVCPAFAGNHHVAMCFANKRYQWNPSRAGGGASWDTCVPEVLTYTGPKRFGNATTTATPAVPPTTTAAPTGTTSLSYAAVMASSSLATSNLIAPALEAAVAVDVSRLFGVPTSHVRVELERSTTTASDDVTIKFTLDNVQRGAQSADMNGIFEFMLERDADATWLSNTRSELRNLTGNPNVMLSFVSGSAAGETAPPGGGAPESDGFCSGGKLGVCVGVGGAVGFLLIALIIVLVRRSNRRGSGTLQRVADDDYIEHDTMQHQPETNEMRKFNFAHFATAAERDESYGDDLHEQSHGTTGGDHIDLNAEFAALELAAPTNATEFNNL